MAGSGVEELYKNFGVLADAGSAVGEHVSEYEGILKAAKGGPGEKKLAAGFITRFFRHFPALADTAIDTLLDLIEDDDPQIRRLAIKSLPDICKGASDVSLHTKVADVLTQLLLTDDQTNLALVKSGLATVLQQDTRRALAGVFEQVSGEDEAVREKALEYVCGPLMSLRHKLFLPHPDNEKALLQLIKKVLVDVTGEEFEALMEVVVKLHWVTTEEGGREVAAIISEQAELGTPFKPEEPELLDRFTTCFRQAVKFSKLCGSTVEPFLRYLCTSVLPHVPSLADDQARQSALQLLADGALRQTSKDTATECLPHVYQCLLSFTPLPPPSDAESSSADPPKLQFSSVECLLFAFHRLAAVCPEFLTADDQTERLKDFRHRLQYFARGSQSNHAQLQAALKGKSPVDVKDEQARLRAVALRTTANINNLVRDFFHNPPTYSTTVTLSWGSKKAEEKPLLQRKRASTERSSSPKRKPSPIRFDEGGGGGGGGGEKRREARSLYSPPKNRFSADLVANGNRGGRGRGRGRGGRGKA